MQEKAHNQTLKDHLTHADDTSLDMITSKKSPLIIQLDTAEYI